MEQPPNDELAEQCLLGAMLISSKVIPEIVETVKRDDFYLPRHQLIYDAIVDMFAAGDAVDPVTVSGELEARGQRSKMGGATYLLDLTQTVPMASNAAEYGVMVVEKAKLRRLSELGVRLQQLAYAEGYGSPEILSQAHQFFRDLDCPDDGRASRFDELMEHWRSWNGSTDDTVPTPWHEVNDWLNGGLAKGRLVTIGGRPSVGKSLGGLNIAAFAAQNNHSAIFFSLEMSREEVTARILASGSQVQMGELVRRRITSDSLKRIGDYATRYADMPLWVDDREQITVEEIAAKCRSIPNLQVAVVDYLQLVTASDSRVSREQQVSHISRSLKIMAREQGIAVVVAAQLNRGPVKDGNFREPAISDLRESGAVEQDSDQVLLLHRQDDAVVKMICGKNRVGKTGDAELNFEGQFARIASFDEETECLRQIGAL